MKTYCSHCKEKTETDWNLYMVQFCVSCKRIKGEPEDYFQPQAYICIHCERGFDETYPGQRVCKSCQEILARGDGD